MRELIEGQRAALLTAQSEANTHKTNSELTGRLLNEVLVERIDLRQQLAWAQKELDRSREDAAGWKARSELVEKMLRDLQHETMVKPFSAFPDRSDN